MLEGSSLLKWEDLLLQVYDYEKAGEKLFPLNPPQQERCKKCQMRIEDVFITTFMRNLFETKKDSVILVQDHGLKKDALPLVTVLRADGSEGDYFELSYWEMLEMEIQLKLSREISKEELVCLLFFYKTYPLRVKRQKKRDSIAMFANLMAQRAQQLS